MKTAPSLPDPVATVEVPGTYTSMPYKDFRALLPKRFDYIKDKSSFVQPLDKAKLQMLETNIQKASDEHMVMQMYMSPNSYLGYYRLEPIKTTPDKVTSFQFEQGQLGWFWFYGTFIDSTGGTASYMFYVNRMDLYPPDLRKSLNLPMGSTTYYNISMGVGRGDKWSFIPFKIARGEYSISSDSVYSLKCLDLPEGWKFGFSSTGKGKFKIEGAFKDDSLKQQGFAMDVISKREPYFNSPKNDGCAPCQAGAGTLYLSYTQMESNGTITVNDSSHNAVKGTSWLDRQWANSEVSLPYMSMLSNSVGLFKDRTWGLGKYIWLNLHLNDTLQYMVFNFFGLTEKVTKGTPFTSMQIRYGKDKPEFNLTGAAEVLDTRIIDGIEYPIKYKIVTKDGLYILDASKFDKSVCVDVSNNKHWDGSGIIYDSTGAMKGTGFLEASQFADENTFVKNQLIGMGLDTTEENRAFFVEEGKLPLSMGLPSLIILSLSVIAIITLAVLAFKGFKKLAVHR